MKRTLLIIAMFSVTFIQCKDDKEETPAVEICGDGIDNDNDGFIDCADFDCNSKCPETKCSDGIDNDSDGFIDCDDADCKDQTSCKKEICDDGIDNDEDGFTDCEDPDCESFSGC